MSQYDGVEALGAAMKSVLDGMGAFRTRAIQIFKENDLEEPVADNWYPYSKWVSTLQRIQEKIGHSTLFQCGKKIPEAAVFPPEINDVHSAVASIDLAYRMNVRGGTPRVIGGYAYTKISDTSAKIVCDNPLPCDFDRGVIEGSANKFKARGQSVKVVHEDGSCRKKGGKSCSYHVSW